MSTVLASSGSQAVTLGAGSIGPFAVPSGSTGLVLSIGRAGMPDVSPLIEATCQASYDGGSTFAPIGGTSIPGGTLTGRKAASSTTVTITWQSTPTHVRIDLDSAAAFTTSFSVTALP